MVEFAFGGTGHNSHWGAPYNPWDLRTHRAPAVRNLEGYARLTADLKTPVQIGENFYGPRALYTALQMKACDYVMPDFMRIGGVTGWQRAAAISAAAGIPISTHLYPEVAAHLMRVSETAHWLEWQDWAADEPNSANGRRCL